MFSNWEEYYGQQKYQVPEFIIQTLQKKYNGAIKKYCDPHKELIIAELGGADSDFFGGFKKHFNISSYHILDNSVQGLKLSSIEKDSRVHIHDVDLLNFNLADLGISADFVFSAGLIEHFKEADTKKMIEAHFALTRAGGVVLMSFPTPTIIYWSFRHFLESTNRFPPLYERPLKMEEVGRTIESLGTILEEFKVWTTILTQQVAIARKK